MRYIEGKYTKNRSDFRSFKCFLRLMRVVQWSKNIFVLAGVFVSIDSLSLTVLLNSVFAFLLFCSISSSVYIINDVLDIEKDKIHPVKRYRPLPAGEIKIKHVLIFVSIIAPITLFFAFILNTYLGYILSGYFLINIFYSFKLKEVVLVDLIIISLGFVMRVLAGTVITMGTIPLWFLLCVAFLTLFLGVNKRRTELVTLEKEAQKHRKNLSEYSIGLLNEIAPMLAACTIISYTFHVLYETNLKIIAITIPLVLYGILRYQYLNNRKNIGGSPELVLLKDKPIILIVLLWGFVYISPKVLTSGVPLW